MEVSIFGESAGKALANLLGQEELLLQLKNVVHHFTLDTDNQLPAHARAIAATFCQVLAFGGKRTYPCDFSSKLERNLYLASINRSIFGVVLGNNPQTIVIEQRRVSLKIPVGHLTGITVTYPLNDIGTSLYQKNSLGPHRFMKQHLMSEQSFRVASSVFLGGAIDIASVQDVLAKRKLDFQSGAEPAGLINSISKTTVDFLPKVTDVVGGSFGPTLRVNPNGQLPMVFTSFSGKGTGENLARKVGFYRESRIERELGDRRYALDMNLLNTEETPKKLRHDLLKAWAWFERTAYPDSSDRIVSAIQRALVQLDYKEA